jgi:hypothetical protein
MSKHRCAAQSHGATARARRGVTTFAHSNRLMSQQIRLYDRQIVELACTRYPETKLLETVNGIGL